MTPNKATPSNRRSRFPFVASMPGQWKNFVLTPDSDSVLLPIFNS